MANWVRIDEDIAEHPKTQWLAEKCDLDIDACVGKLVRLFAKVARFAPHGNLEAISFRTIETWANWHGEPGLFWATFVEFFVTGNTITGWAKRNVERMAYEERERARKAQNQRSARAKSSAPRSAPRSARISRGERATNCGTSTYTSTSTELPQHNTARARLGALFTGRAQHIAFEKACEAWLGGMNLAPGLTAVPDDIERAAGDWLFSNPTDTPTKLAMRKFVERAIRERLANEAAPAPKAPGTLTRPNGKVSVAEQGFVNARRAVGLSDYPAEDEKSPDALK